MIFSVANYGYVFLLELENAVQQKNIFTKNDDISNSFNCVLIATSCTLFRLQV